MQLTFLPQDAIVQGEVAAAGTLALSAPAVTAGDGTAFQLCTAEVWQYLVSHTHGDPQGGFTTPPAQTGPANPLTSSFRAS